ncbi:hypothetical protein ACFQ6N_00660 [Kitasatospora sp. NPDC056446]|uniref:hypothetical protein n=1 Tax=Kitasatospora sp. NPDC056446 TaxID=3345819 RepID=UPI0036831AB2
MLRLRATRRTLALAAGALALATGATIATSGTAFAANDNWQNWAGNCFGYTLFNGNQVTGYVVSHNGAWCNVSIYQNDTKGSGTSGWTSSWTTGSTNTPTWWHGYASDGGVLTDWVCVRDYYAGATTCSGVYN